MSVSEEVDYVALQLRACKENPVRNHFLKHESRVLAFISSSQFAVSTFSMSLTRSRQDHNALS